MTKVKNREIGSLAEELARKALMQKGYQILENNFQNKFGEIDIVAKDKDVLVFVEVKSKVGEDFGMPEEMVNAGKLNKVKHMAQIYTGGKEVPSRIDVVAIVLSTQNDLLRLTHYENVYF